MQFSHMARGCWAHAADFFLPPFGHPNSLKIALARAVCAKVRARAPLHAEKAPVGALRCQKVPQWTQNGPKMGANGSPKCAKNRSYAKKCRMWFGPIIYYIFSLPAPSKTSLLDTSKQPKCKSFLSGASDAAPGLQNGAPEVEKWRDWGPPGSPRVPKGPPMPPKMLPKIVQKSSKNQHPLQDCLQGCSRGASGTPPPPKYLHF